MGAWECECVHVWEQLVEYVCVCMFVCKHEQYVKCVRERERERERESLCIWKRQRVFMWEREREEMRGSSDKWTNNYWVNRVYFFVVQKTLFLLRTFMGFAALAVPTDACMTVHALKKAIGCSNEALSDVNKLLDGCTNPGWKMTLITRQNIFLASVIHNRLSSGASNAT